MFKIEYSKRSEKFLKNCDKHIALRIIERIDGLRINQVPQDAKFIGRESGEMIFRYRIGDYRALYKIKYSEKVVLVVRIDKRPRVYS